MTFRIPRCTGAASKASPDPTGAIAMRRAGGRTLRRDASVVAPFLARMSLIQTFYLVNIRVNPIFAMKGISPQKGFP
jgi:hypothetical protein